MSYKVFLVEDEIVAREGIRDNVDWKSAGFDFCGEAPDGEIALPLIQQVKPDVLITDIKMPFMDGLQLSKIVREHLPWVKIIIFSGHDEFEYAQAALKIGVTDYLLKPVSSADIMEVLQRVAAVLNQEKSERENLRQLESRVEYNLQLQREQLLLRLVMGGISSGAAIEQGQQLGLDLVARYYLVLLIKIELCDDGSAFDYNVYQQINEVVSSLTGNNSDILLTKKDIEELVLMLKGDDEEQLRQEGNFWADLIQKEIASGTECRLIIEMGSPQHRLSDIHRSFAEALARAKNPARIKSPTLLQARPERVELQNFDHSALVNYLNIGSVDTFDSFFEKNLRSICIYALLSPLVMHYLFIEIVLTIAQFVSDLGDVREQAVPDIQEIEETLQIITTIEQLRAEIKQRITSALAYRNKQVNRQRSISLYKAKTYIDEHFRDPGLQMRQVAQIFNFSPTHFSTVFSQEIGESFRDYLNNLRLNHAKELLRTTNLKCTEVAIQSGYNDSHYFSAFFKKKTGVTPQRFRAQT